MQLDDQPTLDVLMTALADFEKLACLLDGLIAVHSDDGEPDLVDGLRKAKAAARRGAELVRETLRS